MNGNAAKSACFNCDSRKYFLNFRSYLLHEIKGLTSQDALLSRSLSESDVSELCPSVKGPSPSDDRLMAPSVGVAGNDDGFLTGFVTEHQPSQPPRPVLPPKQRRAGGGGGGNDPPSSLLQQQQPNGEAQRGGGGGGTAGAPGNVAIVRARLLNDITTAAAADSRR